MNSLIFLNSGSQYLALMKKGDVSFLYLMCTNQSHTNILKMLKTTYSFYVWHFIYAAMDQDMYNPIIELWWGTKLLGFLQKCMTMERWNIGLHLIQCTTIKKFLVMQYLRLGIEVLVICLAPNSWQPSVNTAKSKGQDVVYKQFLARTFKF